MKNCTPKLNAEGDPNRWLSGKGTPCKKLADKKPKGEMTAYDKLLRA
jgi:glycerol transport system substrate-binding protein